MTGRELDALIAAERARCHAVAVAAVSDAFEAARKAVSKGSAPYGDAFMCAVICERIGEKINEIYD